MSPDRDETLDFSVMHIKSNETKIVGNLRLHEYSILFYKSQNSKIGRVVCELLSTQNLGPVECRTALSQIPTEHTDNIQKNRRF